LYENVFIARQDVSSAQVDGLIETFEKVISDLGGSVPKKELWGLRTMAYKIKKNRKGHFVLINIDAPGEAIHEMERQMRLHEDVLRYLTTRVDELEEGPSAVLRAKERSDDRGRRDSRDDDRGSRGSRESGPGDKPDTKTKEAKPEEAEAKEAKEEAPAKAEAKPEEIDAKKEAPVEAEAKPEKVDAKKKARVEAEAKPEEVDAKKEAPVEAEAKEAPADDEAGKDEGDAK
jgi:small subunit ribosomal protein S6